MNRSVFKYFLLIILATKPALSQAQEPPRCSGIFAAATIAVQDLSAEKTRQAQKRAALLDPFLGSWSAVTAFEKLYTYGENESFHEVDLERMGREGNLPLNLEMGLSGTELHVPPIISKFDVSKLLLKGTTSALSNEKTNVQISMKNHAGPREDRYEKFTFQIAGTIVFKDPAPDESKTQTYRITFRYVPKMDQIEVSYWAPVYGGAEAVTDRVIYKRN